METAIPSTIPVEFTERVVYLSGQMEAYRTQIGGAIVFGGKLDESRLRRVLRLILDAEPVLGCRFMSDEKPPVWRRLDGLDSIRLLEVRESDDPIAEATAFVAEPLDSEVGPQIRAALIRGRSSDLLAVCGGHVAMDGGALKEALYLIGDVYRALAEDGDWTPQPNLDGIRGPKTRATIAERLRAMRPPDLMPPPSDLAVPLLGGRGPVSYVLVTVEPEVLRSAAASAKRTGATINDVVLAALYRTVWRVLGMESGARTPIMITSDIRRHLPDGTKTALANISSAHWITTTAANDEGFDETLARVRDVTGKWKRAGAGKDTAIGAPIINRITRGMSMDSLRKMMFGKTDSAEPSQQTQVLVFTNIGVIDADRLSFGPEIPVQDAWLFGPPSHVGIGLAASTYLDRLHLVCGTEFASVSEDLVAEVVAGTVKEIEGWVATNVIWSVGRPRLVSGQ